MSKEGWRGKDGKVIAQEVRSFLRDADLPVKNISGNSSGYAIITFQRHSQAARAQERFLGDFFDFEHENNRVNFNRNKIEHTDGGNATGTANDKGKEEAGARKKK